jgi:transcription initiation factor IIE alpha subunit
MVTITCPWCDADELVEFRLLESAGSEFVCPDCGTAVRFVDTERDELDLAA